MRIKQHAGQTSRSRIKILNSFVYSSFAGYSNTRKRDDFVEYQTVLEYFGGDTKIGRAAYRQFVYRGLNDEESKPLDIGKGSGIIGSARFIDRIKAKYLSGLDPSSQREQPKLKEIRASYSPDELIDLFCSLTQCDRAEICRKGKNAIERSMLMELLYRFCHIKQPGIGRYLGDVDYSAVSISRKRLRIRMEKDASLKERFHAILNNLSGIKILTPSHSGDPIPLWRFFGIIT